MSATISVFDETVSGKKTHSLDLEFETAVITARELIRKRVYEEVREYNLKTHGDFRGLVQPQGAEATLNGFKLKQRRRIDWEEQAQKAEDAFARNGFFILAADRQIENLDEKIEIGLRTEVAFVKLTPLVGG